MKKSANPQRKKILLLAILLAVLAGTLSWQWAHRDRPPAAVKDETEHRALALFMEMIEAGRLRGWDETERFWRTMPDRQTRNYYQQLMGSRFKTEFTFQGSAPVADMPGRIVLYGIFDAGIPVEVLISVHDDEFKVVSMQPM